MDVDSVAESALDRLAEEIRRMPGATAAQKVREYHQRHMSKMVGVVPGSPDFYRWVGIEGLLRGIIRLEECSGSVSCDE